MRRACLRRSRNAGSFSSCGAPAPASSPAEECTMHRHVLRVAAVTGAIIAAACVEYAPVTPTVNNATQTNTAGTPSLQLSSANLQAKSYVLDFVGTQLPADLAAQVSAAGGTLTSSFDKIGVAVAASNDPAFADRASKIKGVSTVTEDIDVQWVTPEHVVGAGEAGEAGSL